MLLPKEGVHLLATLKPIKRQGWWKGKFALFWRPATWGEGGRLSKGQLPRADGARAFIGGGRGAACRNSTVSSDSHLEFGYAVV